MRWEILLAGLLPALALRAEVAVTVYNQDLAVVRETRPFDLPDGAGTLRFTDVASQIDPTSVSLAGPGGLRVLEQSFDDDLLSSDKLLQRYLGLKLTAWDKAGKPTLGTLLSFDGGQLVLGDAQGGAQMLARQELARLEFPQLPGGLLTRPTLSWKVEGAKPGSAPLTLTYMTRGFSWHAEYVAVVAEDEKSLGLAGWVSLEDNCGASFKSARLKLVAGDVNRASAPQPLRRAMLALAAAPPAEGGFQERSFFEYHLYTLDHPVDLQDQQVKQVQLLSAARVPVKKIYTYEASQDPKAVKVALELENKAGAGLGMPLPGGKLRAYKADQDQSLQFIGEDRVEHTPQGETLRVELGKSFDVVAERRETGRRRLSDKVGETQVEIKLRNHRPEAVSVAVLEHAAGDWSVTAQSQDFRKKDAGSFEFIVPLAAQGEATLTYTLRQE